MAALKSPPKILLKPTHRYDTKAYHDYYIHQAGKGYPVFAGRRYQRGHGLGSVFGGLFKAAMMSFYNSLSWGPTVSIAFWSKFSPVDFNRDFAACLIFLTCTTYPAIFNPVLSPVKATISDRGNRYKGRHGLYCAIRKRTSGGDTSL
jgi:hypothetical protein